MRRKAIGYDWVKIGGLLLILLIDTLVVAAVVVACNGCTGRSKAAVTHTDIAKEDIPQKQDFSLPVIPETLTDPLERTQYLVSHYWDNLDFSDTNFIRSAEKGEQAFVDYINLFPHVSQETLSASIGGTLEKSRNTQALYEWFTSLYDKYLYDPNSPFRQEEYYAVVLESILKLETDETNKIRPAFQLEEINKNRKGAIASDFSYILTNGSQGNLHGIKSEYTLLFFYNPGCGDCKRAKGMLERSTKITEMVDRKKLKVIALYTDDDLVEWQDYHSAIPQSWFNARDGSKDQIIKGKLFAIRAIPSLYLLDKDKRVVLKDATTEQVLEKLEQVL